MLFGSIISKIQNYDNFIVPVVDSLKYLSSMAFDVMAFCLIEALANPGRQRIKQSDTNLSRWLQSLSTFTSNIFKKYSVELSGILQVTDSCMICPY